MSVGLESTAGALAVLANADADTIGSAFYGLARFNDATRERLRRTLAEGLTYHPGLSPEVAAEVLKEHGDLVSLVSTLAYYLKESEHAVARKHAEHAEAFLKAMTPRCHTAHHPSRGLPMEPCGSCGKPLSCGPFQHGCVNPSCRANPGKCLMCGTSRVHCVC